MLKIMVSASHIDNKTTIFIEKLKIIYNMPAITIAAGSSLKICLLATNETDIYPRLGDTCGWDTAAAHAILKSAGGELYNAATLKPLKYNIARLLNPHFIGMRSNLLFQTYQKGQQQNEFNLLE